MDIDAIRVLHQGNPDDTRFQFEVIKQLAESVKVQSDMLRSFGETQTRMLERLARIEEQKVHEAVSGLAGRVNALESERDQRDGAKGALNGFLKWWGPLVTVIGVIFTVVFLLLRATGILHLPDSGPAVTKRVETEVNREVSRE